MKRLKTHLQVALFIAWREVIHTSIWTKAFVPFVIMITFLNMVVVNGILVGFVDGAINANRNFYTGEVFLTAKQGQPYIDNSTLVEQFIQQLPGVSNLTARYISLAKLEAEYQNQKQELVSESTNSLVVGIDPIKEDEVTHLSQTIIDGNYLSDNDENSVLVGANVLKRFSPVDSPLFKPLVSPHIGSKVQLVVNNQTEEFVVKGIIRTKVVELDQRVYIHDTELQKLLGRDDFNVNEIAVRLYTQYPAEKVEEQLYGNGYERYAVISNWKTSQPKVLADIRGVFLVLGSILGGFSLAAAAATNFIVSYIQVMTKRRQIGVLSSIGIDQLTIELIFVFQTLLYVCAGLMLGLFITYGLLKPYIIHHPIDFPLSNGTFVAPLGEIAQRVVLIVVISVVAGFIPARLIVNKSSLRELRVE